MPDIIAAIIGAIATIIAAIIIVIGTDKKTRGKIFAYLQNRWKFFLSIILILLILSLFVYICFLHLKIQTQANKIQIDNDKGKENTIINLAVLLTRQKEIADSTKVEIAKLEKKIDTLTVVIDDRKNEVSEKESKLINLIEQRDKLEAQHSIENSIKIDSLRQEINKRKNEIASLKEKIRSLEDEKSNLNDKRIELEKNLEEAKETIKELSTKLKKAQEELNQKIGFEISDEDETFNRIISWSPDKKYLAVMHFWGDTGDVSILDLSAKREINCIPIEKPYSNIEFSSDGKKIFADDDTLKIEEELPHLSLERNLLPNDKEKNTTSKDEIKLKIKRPLFKLRGQPTTLSDEEVKAVIKKYNFFNADFNKAGDGLANQFEVHTLNGDKVVIDKATGLMWQQGGSSRDMIFTDTIKWIKEFNRKGYAGYHDWRLPTLEEAMSLMEPETKMSEQEKRLREIYFFYSLKKIYTVYIDPIFNKLPPWIWTSDLCDQKGIVLGSFAWAVYFTEGRLNNGPHYDEYYIRAVRSGQSNEMESVILKNNSITISSLRSNFTTLSEQEVIAMLKKYNFYESRWNQNGIGVENQYEIEIINGDTIVSDRATGLMWQQSGSFLMWQKRDLRLFVKPEDAHSLIKEFAQRDDSSRAWQEGELPSFISFKETRNWIRELNRKGYAGYHDWRLPTLEEAMSLMEPETKNGYLYIDPVFNNTQVSFWTGDTVKDRSHAVWIVNFNGGFCVYQYFGEYLGDNNYIRAVRSR